MAEIDVRIENWKKRLLDLGKRNRLISFKETKRTNLAILLPDYSELFHRLVLNEEKLAFPFPKKTTFDENGEEINTNVEQGDIETDKTLNEQQKNLKALRARAKTSMEEQGINSLFLTFGMIRWRESEISDLIISSPLVLVPVTLTIESISDPYVLQLHEEEIVVNPSLAFKFENDFGIPLPDFDEEDIAQYLRQVQKIARKNDWTVETDVHLTLLSFQKINMYKDLDNNKEKIVSNSTIKALSGDKSEITLIPNELNNFDHDKNIRPIDTFQVVDADSSQQDAILLSKKGLSFVLQGPPGTGKSQTITNIIAEAIADGKKALFVSEKMAALEVVKKRLTEAGLSDFCLTLHSYKANKKDVLNQLEKTLYMNRIGVRQDALYKLSVLEERRKSLNEYQEQLHQKCLPLNISIYEANGRLAKLSSTKDIIFNIPNVESTNLDLLNKYRYLLVELSNTIGKMSEDYIENPWYGCNVPRVTHELRHDLEVNLEKLMSGLRGLFTNCESITTKLGTNIILNYSNIVSLIELLDFSAKAPTFPVNWLSKDIPYLRNLSQSYFDLFSEYNDNKSWLVSRYTEDIFTLTARETLSAIESNVGTIQKYLNATNFRATKDIILHAESILAESKNIKTTLLNLINQNQDVSALLGMNPHNNISSLLELTDLLDLILKNPKPVEQWLVPGEIQHSVELMQIAANKQSKINDELKKLTESYNRDILDMGSEKVLRRFQETYNSIFKNMGEYYSVDYLNLTKENVLTFIANNLEPTERFYSYIKNAIDICNQLEFITGIKAPQTLNSLAELEGLLSQVIQNPSPTLAWFDENKKSQIDKLIADAKRTHEEIKHETDELLSEYNRDVLSIDYRNMLIRFNSEYTSVFKYLKKSYSADRKTIRALSKIPNKKILDSDIVGILNRITQIKEKEQWLLNNKTLINELLGAFYVGDYTDWELIDQSRERFKSIQQYFGGGRIPEKLKQVLIDCAYENVSKHHSIIAILSENKVSEFLDDVFGFEVGHQPVEELLKTMLNITSCAKEIKTDYELIFRQSVNSGENITIREIIAVLMSINEINMQLSWFRENADQLLESFGAFYNGEQTNWVIVKQNLGTVEKIIEYFVSKHMDVPIELKHHLKNANEPHHSLVILSEQIRELTNLDVESRLNYLTSIANSRFEDLNDIVQTLKSIEYGIFVSQENYLSIINCSRTAMQFEDVMSDIALLKRIQEIESKVAIEKLKLQTDFESVFNFMGTDWKKIIADLEYADRLIRLGREYDLSQEYISGLSHDRRLVGWAADANKGLKQQYDDTNTYFDWFTNLFDNKDQFYEINANRLLDKLEACGHKVSALEEWVDFRGIRQQCKEMGLTDFVEKVEQVSIPPSEIVDTFFKRFYRLWLDVMVSRYPAVNSFRGRSHQSIIQEFNELDKSQLHIAQLRILERLIAKLPDTNMATSSVDEVGILTRELTKQRKIMPLRRLFRTIPNLLTALKPCLMMSPLSVSMFLQADGYIFDIVIFDEASQVCTEDAVGAIMRGKQVIIAGDSKQLPPTSFFTATLSDGDFDNDIDDEEFDDTGAYDSVLEEAVNAIPERTLKWHYRSRHEHLIAFSNAKIYNNGLITFPSNTEQIPDNGVEYIYVEDGVYDRGGKKHNIREAQRVAKLVFEHIKTHPTRSLGVVTFSEAQQQAIDNAIRKLRLENTQYENFFTEDAENAFFIKNLENVQGDERDTIIFSIGYAKDSSGVMYMNFGPLSRTGGHRRLNVAITRAKFNVKLVGSIHPTDIKIENTNSEGVKMLRQYIEFAMNGVSVLENELTFTSTIEVESPFEEAVYDFLVQNGYQVTTQVGCSGYRIDMAVKHPTLSGIFVVGVECDGATYHSARTARERDRLRQTVLEDIGWNIYRIWSTDWIKDPAHEGSKLLEAVKFAISNYNTNNTWGSNNQSNAVKQEIYSAQSFRTETPLLIEKDPNNPYGFDYYIETDVYDIDRVPNDSQYIANVISYVVENEAPIHYELLCKRVAGLFGNIKATSKVRESVDLVLNRYLNATVMKCGDFCWHKNTTEVKVRISRYGVSRTINHISIEELAEAMYVITAKSIGILRMDLYVITARVFGFNRTGVLITQAMEKACSFLLDTNRVKEIDGKIVI